MRWIGIGLFCGISVASLAQEVFQPAPEQALARSLADLQGMRDDGLVTFLAQTPLFLGPMPPGHAPPPQRTAAPVSIARLGHKVPRAAQKAYRRASTFVEEGNTARATEEYQRAIALDPDYVEAHCDLGVVYYLSHRYERAEAQFRRAASLAPDLPIAHSNLAWALLTQGKTDEAAEAARQALALSNDNVHAHRLLGHILAAVPETRLSAIEHLEAAIRLVTAPAP